MSVLKENKIDEAEHARRKLVICHLLADNMLMRSCGSLIKRHGMLSSCPDLEFIWTHCLGYYEQYSSMPPELLLSFELKSSYDTWMQRDKFSWAYMSQCVHDLYGLTEDQKTEQYVVDLLNQWKTEATVKQLSEHSRSFDPTNKSALSEMERLVRTAQAPVMTALETEDPFGDWEEYVQDAGELIPTCIPWLDEMLGGGAKKGELLLWLIPQKSGKTTLSMQMVDAMSLAQQPCMYFSFEQAIKGDLAQRSVILGSGWGRSQWERISWNKDNPAVPADVRERLRTAQERYRKYVRLVNGKSTKSVIASVRDLFDAVQRYEELEGFSPRFLILDWWGRLKDKMTQNLTANRRISDAELRMHQRAWLQELKDLAEKQERIICMFHQMRGAENAKSASHIGNAATAQEDTNIGNACDMVFVSSKKDRAGNVRHVADVSRTRGNMQKTLFLNAERARLEEMKLENPAMTAENLTESVDFGNEFEGVG